ncbi:thermophilic serine proteinase [Abditibacteriota bacterium]|nr:thermophilic serine proteinase [Abditibacteriota bacterium]
MNIRSRFAPRAPQCELAKPPLLDESPRKTLKSALRLAFLASLSFLGVSGAAHAQTVQVRTIRGVTTARAGELLVKFGSTAPNSLTAIRSNIHSIRTKSLTINSRIGATELQSFGSIGWQLVKLPDGMSVEEGIKFYESQPGVADAEPNAMRYLMAVPNDPAYSQQYGLAKIGAPAAWNKTTGNANTIVAIIDSGINYTHEDLAANMWKNPKEIAGNGKDDDGNGYVDDVYGIDAGDHDTNPMDANHHGSHCAGIIGAAGNNGIGVSGVNWNVKLMACKVLNAQGGIPSASVIEAMQYVATMKARGNNIRVINESLGGPTYVQAEKDAFDALNNAGILVAAAAGNETNNNDTKASYPASYDCPNIIAVAASDSSDDVASFSNYGATTVDLAAPGVDIYSTFWPGNNAYSNLSGTSMATPMVAGAAALLSSFSPTQTPITLKKLLMDTVDPLPQWDGRVVSGGRMNLARALVAVDPNGLPIVTSTSPHGVATALRPAVVVNFSKPMNPASVQSNWSFAPNVTGTFAWTNNNQTVTFTPSANLAAGTMYEGCIKGTAISAAGVKLDGNVSGTSTGSPDDDYRWNFRIVGAPSNDNFARAMPISGDSGYVPAFNMGATREAGEPSHHNYYGNGDKSVWFKWTAPVTGNLLLNTAGSTFSHVIAIYTGSSVGALTTQQYADCNFTGRSVVTELRVQAGTTYSIAIDGDFYPQTETTPPFTDTGNIRLAWQLYRSPSNDFYASAQNISGISGSVTGNTLGSYSEPGEGNHIGADSSVWYRWTAPANGAVTFDTIGSSFDTALSVAVGTTIGSAKEVAHDRDGGGTGGTSVMPFTVSAGTTYYISVGGAGYAFYDARGDFKLNWKFVNAPTNDSFVAPIVLNPANGGTLTTSTYGATEENGEPEILYHDGIASIWYTWTAPSSGALSLDTLGSSFNTNLGVFTGNTLAGLTKIDENDDNASIENEATSKVKFTAVKGVTYRIRIDSPAYAPDDASVGYPATHGSVRLTWGFTPAPSNDLFANAQILLNPNGGVVGSNVGANIEDGEPQPNFHDEGESVWYKWTAPGNGAITFDVAGSMLTNGSPMDTYLAVYTGSQLEGLTLTTEDDDDASNAPTQASRVRFTVAVGTTYYIRIDNASNHYGDSGQSYDRTHGSIALSWFFVNAPSNDNFASYSDLGSAASGRTAGTTYGAGLEPNEDNPTYRDTSASIWYRWTAPTSGSTTFSTAGSKDLDGHAYDTHMTVYTGSQIDGLDWINQNDDDGSLPTSKVTFSAEAGTTYVIRIDGVGPNTYDSVKAYNYIHGIVNLTWSLGGSPISGPTITGFTPASGGAGTSVTINGTNLGGTTDVYFDGNGGVITSITATSVKATAPASVRTGRITVKTPNGSAVSDTDFKVVPTITSFSPTSGPVGTQVTIDGTGFRSVTGVTIGGASASFSIVSPTRLTAIVPGGAVSGKITVTTAGGTAVSAGVFSMPPRIDSFSPASGPIGTRVQIKGINFLGTTSVLFNTTPATAPTITGDMISVAVPANATTGPISVVAPSGTVKSAANFVVLTPPVVTGFTPSGGKVGTSVTISGANFTGATAVRFNGVAAVNPKIAATSIVAVVPAAASTGPVSVTTPQGDGQSATNFVVDGEAPSVTITNPVGGSTLTVLPKNFAGTVNDNGGVANIQSVVWVLARTTGTNQYTFWNATNGTWGTSVNNATSPVRPSTQAQWVTAGVLPTGANLIAGTYTLQAIATDKGGNTTTGISSFWVQAQPTTSYSVSGRITLGTAGLANVTVTRTGNLSVVTNTNGDFTFTGIAANTSITMTPALAGYTFNPTSRNVTVATANVAGQNFAATQTAPSPTIASFSPASGPVGTQVTINGTNLSTATAVKFGTVAAAINSKTATQIVTTVPTGAVTAKINVTTPAGTVISAANFTVTTATSTAPTITSFTPVSGPVGTQVTINGANLSTVTSVKFNGLAAVIKGKNATQIVAVVPTGAITGRISVTSGTGTATSAGNFTVTTTTPTPDTTAPVVAFTTPAANATYSALATATGTASDAGTGVKGVYLQLYKVSADGKTIVAVYDWTAHTWGTDDSLDSTIAVAAGTTSWKLTLPTLPSGIYEIYATALDNAAPANQTQWLGRRFTISGTTVKDSAGAS